MNCKSKFSELAQQIIKNYFQEFSGSLQNNSHSQALLYSQKIERLRTNFLNYLGISNNYLVSIQPSKHYLEKIILNFLDSEAKEWKVFANCSELRLKKPIIYSLQEFLNREEIFNPIFVYLDGKSSEPSLISEVSRKLDYFRKKCQIVYSYFSSKSLKTLREQSLEAFSFISYDPSEELSEFGSVFFGFRKCLRLKPVFLGSGGAKFDHQSVEIKLREVPYLLEIGTQNLISWIVLAEYFEKLSQNSNIPLDSIKDVS